MCPRSLGLIGHDFRGCGGHRPPETGDPTAHERDPQGRCSRDQADYAYDQRKLPRDDDATRSSSVVAPISSGNG